MIIMSNRHGIARRESLVQRFIKLAVDVFFGFSLFRHATYISKTAANNKKARYTEVPTPPCSKLAHF
jgi:hypothetical protein